MDHLLCPAGEYERATTNKYYCISRRKFLRSRKEIANRAQHSIAVADEDPVMTAADGDRLGSRGSLEIRDRPFRHDFHLIEIGLPVLPPRRVRRDRSEERRVGKEGR